MPKVGEDMRRRTGVYKITNKVNGKVYVGSGAQARYGMWARWIDHRSSLNNGRHCNQILSRAWVKYGEGAFEFSILEVCPPEKCIEREQFWMDRLDATNHDKGYNILPTAGSCLGRKVSESTKAKISDSLMGHEVSMKSRLRIQAKNKGKKTPNRKPVSAEVRAQMSTSRKGKRPTDQARANISAGLTGHVTSEETKKKISDAHKNKVVSEETRKKIAESRTGKKASKETIAKMSAANKGKKLSTEHIAKIRESNRKTRESRKQTVVMIVEERPKRTR